MKLSTVIRSRMLTDDPGVSFSAGSLRVELVGLNFKVPSSWEPAENVPFERFRNEATFAISDEVSKRELAQIRKCLFPPLFMVSKKSDGIDTHCVFYLYERIALTGGSVMHIRSINKYEQMWARYLVTFRGERNPKRLVVSNSFASLSNNLNLLEPDLVTPTGNMRILMIDHSQYVSCFYFASNGSEDDLLSSCHEIMNEVHLGLGSASE